MVKKAAGKSNTHKSVVKKSVQSHLAQAAQRYQGKPPVPLQKKRGSGTG